jgi:hypothetical protein
MLMLSVVIFLTSAAAAASNDSDRSYRRAAAAAAAAAAAVIAATADSLSGFFRGMLRPLAQLTYYAGGWTHMRISSPSRIDVSIKSGARIRAVLLSNTLRTESVWCQHTNQCDSSALCGVRRRPT